MITFLFWSGIVLLAFGLLGFLAEKSIKKL